MDGELSVPLANSLALGPRGTLVSFDAGSWDDADGVVVGGPLFGDRVAIGSH